jgi:hypothetical protein
MEPEDDYHGFKSTVARSPGAISFCELASSGNLSYRLTNW